MRHNRTEYGKHLAIDQVQQHTQQGCDSTCPLSSCWGANISSKFCGGNLQKSNGLYCTNFLYRRNIWSESHAWSHALFPKGQNYSDFKPNPLSGQSNHVTLTFIMWMSGQSDILECVLLKRGNLGQRVCWNVSISRPPASHIRTGGPGMGNKLCGLFHASEPSC